MVKLASAREIRMYGPRLGRNRAEYMNAGLYVFATIVLTGGFAAIFSMEPRSGLVLLCIALALIVVVNLHDLIAHLTGIDYRLRLMEFDAQLGLVEFAVPVVQIFGALLFFLGIFFLFLQEEKGYGFFKFEKHALNMLIAGPVLWLVGSIHNSCQIYERAGGHVQILQESVQIPFLMGSLLFLVGAVLNILEQPGVDFHGLQLLSRRFVWMGICGSLMLFTGGLTNVVKVFKMQQIDGLRLEKLRGGAQEQLINEREGLTPLIPGGDEERRRKMIIEEIRAVPTATPTPTPYKDVLLSQQQQP
ncbi:uncharacterized protein [Euphorbia lathyris]|uniref:uncharacterized protein n=1 Tax=Euphorbia lathyris TaxID=212925 RepID=UPI0033133363